MPRKPSDKSQTATLPEQASHSRPQEISKSEPRSSQDPPPTDNPMSSDGDTKGEDAITSTPHSDEKAPPADSVSQQPETSCNLMDDPIIRKAYSTKHWPLLARLLCGKWEDVGIDEPSYARIALCTMLAYYGDSDPAKIDSIFRQTPLMGYEWDDIVFSDGTTVGQHTIKKAIESIVDGKLPSWLDEYMDDEPRLYLLDGTDYPIEKTFVPQLTDLSNARKFAKMYENEFRYVPDWKCWIFWDTRYWKRDNNGRVRRKAMEFVEGLAKVADHAREREMREKVSSSLKPTPESNSIEELIDLVRSQVPTEQEQEIDPKLRSFALASQSGTSVDAITDLAMPLLPISTSELDNHPDAINGWHETVDLRSGIKCPHMRKDLFTKILPVSYHPAKKAPTWMNFLDRMLGGDQDMIEKLQRALGYTATGFTFERTVFILHGPDKSDLELFFCTLVEVFGTDYTHLTKTSHLLKNIHNHAAGDISQLHCKRFLYSLEGEDGVRLALDKIDDLTGMPILWPSLWPDGVPCEAQMEFKYWIGTNWEPRLSEEDYALKKHISLFPFQKQISASTFGREATRHLRIELAQERLGIWAWIVEGAKKWFRLGLLDGPVEKHEDAKTNHDRSDVDEN